jgi:ATP-dependent DNA helicase DinG
MPEEPFQNRDSRNQYPWNDDAVAAFLPYLPDDGGDEPMRTILTRLIRSSVPISLLVALGKRCRFPGLPLLEYVASTEIASKPRTLLDPDSGAECPRGLKERAIPTHGGDDGGGGDRDELDAVFGRIFSLLGEERPGQLRMALAVDEALRDDVVVLIEAGTGIGKSLAYLVPALIFSQETGERVIISTHTKNLQDQLLRRELPLAGDVVRGEIAIARLMGRESYICAKRLLSLITGIMDDDPETALAVGIGSALSRQGTVESLPATVCTRPRGRLRAPSRCAMNGCTHAVHCPLVTARKRAREAAILVVNHALLMTDYRQGGAILGPYRRVIFDEAHHLERCAMENLSLAASRDDVERILGAVRPVSERDERWRLLCRELGRDERPLSDIALTRSIIDAIRMLGELYGELIRAIESCAEGADLWRQGKTRFIDGEAAIPGIRNHLNDYLLHYNKLKELLHPLLEGVVTGEARSFQQEVTFALEELAELSDSLPFIIRAEDEDSVFWMEWLPDGKLGRICASPLSVDRLFADYIEEVCDTAVFTSATLTGNDGFLYLRERLGLGGLSKEVTGLVVPSPFEFERSCLILTNSELGDPNDEGYAAVVADVLIRLMREVHRRTMVLFTSNRLCRGTARGISVESLPGPVFVQGEGGSREQLSERFRRSEAGILLGVASFWEGVDFPGEELEILVIPKLPFPVPTEPIVEARSERFRALGEDPFERLFLPESILRLRQGIGRLIRRKSDRGVVIMLDSRIESRPYGDTILSNLPSPVFRTTSVAGIVSATRRWFLEEE